MLRRGNIISNNILEPRNNLDFVLIICTFNQKSCKLDSLYFIGNECISDILKL